MIKVRKDKADKMASKGEYSLFLSFNYNPMIVTKIKGLQSRWYHADKREWEVPESDSKIFLMRFEGIHIEGDIPKEEKQESIRERLRDIQPIVEFDFKTKPYPHQIEAFNYGLNNNCFLLADEQGLGKTKESIDIAVALKKERGLRGTLIVCGINGIKYNWTKEVQLHSDETYQLIAGSSEQKLEQIKEAKDFFFNIINVESLRNEKIVKAIQKLIDRGIIGAIIFDEVHKCKNGSSQQGKGLRKLNTPIKIALTGTPIMNKAEDLWNILTWLGVINNTFYAFRNRYCIMGGFGGYQVVGYKNLDELSLKLNSCMLRRKTEDVLDLPEKINIIDYVELTGKQKLVYKQIRDELLREIDELVLNPSPLSKMMRLRQCTAGLEVLLEGEAESVKFARLEELLEEEIIPNGKKAVIFSNWTKVTKKLREKLAKYNPAYITGEVTAEERNKMVEKFQKDSNCKVIIGTIGAMGTGLTLTAGNYCIFMDKAWTPADNEQAEKRCHRIGTTEMVKIITLVAKDTIDERIEDILITKRELVDQVVEGKATRQSKKKLVEFLLS